MRPPTTSTSADTLVHTQKKVDFPKQSRFYPDAIDEEYISKAIVDLGDSSFSVYGNIRNDYRIFGYQQPDTNSKALILFSVFTRDVDHNPYQCTYGSFYQTSTMEKLEIKYKSVSGSFVLTELYVDGRKASDIYFEKKWVEFNQ